MRPFRERMRIRQGDRRKRQEMQDDPERLRPKLEAADEGDAVRHQRNDDDGADDVAERERNAEAHLQRERHDRRFDREEDEREGRVDQRRDRRADIAEAGAAREQVDVDAVGRGVIGDRQAAEEDDARRRRESPRSRW